MLEEAVKDIEAIYRYIRKSGNKKAAKDMVINIRKACDSLSENPERGHIPAELSQIGQFEYRQLIEKKYRIIYQLAKPNIFVFGIIHGNRNIGEVLRQRMLLWNSSYPIFRNALPPDDIATLATRVFDLRAGKLVIYLGHPINEKEKNMEISMWLISNLKLISWVRPSSPHYNESPSYGHAFRHRSEDYVSDPDYPLESYL